MLLTRSPLSENPKILFTFDLHVLSTPPAFILSQDQTLHKEFDSVDSPSPSVCPQTDNSGQSYLIQTELFVLSQRLGFEFDCLTTLQLLMYFPAASYSLTSHSQLVSRNWCPATGVSQLGILNHPIPQPLHSPLSLSPCQQNVDEASTYSDCCPLLAGTSV